MVRFVHVRYALTLTALLIALAAIGLAAYAIVIKAQAQAILLDVSQLRVGISSEAEVAHLAEKHRSRATKKDCGPKRCTYFFEVTNSWLARVRIEPDALLQAWATVDHGVVQSIHVFVERDTKVFPSSPSGGIVEERVEYPKYLRSGEAHYGFPTPVGKPYLWVELDSHATAEQRSHAYAFSLTCLTKPGKGCDLACDYLPLAWKDWEAELKAEGWGFGEYYPTRARCK
jgi:hypothetical protein